MSNLGFGIMRFRYGKREECIKSIIDEYMLNDFCYFDLHPDYCDGKSQQIFNEYISSEYERTAYFVANKMPYYGISDYSDYEKIFQSELQECGVKYFDYYLLHCINITNYKYHEKWGGFKFLKELKARSLAHKIGISFHGTPELLEEILFKYEFVEFVQLQINFMDWQNDAMKSKECYEIAQRYNKEILVMEPIKGGTISKEIMIDGQNITASQMADLAIRFVTGLEGISIILSGMTDINHVINNKKSLKKSSLPYSFYAEIIQQLSEENIIPCTGCGYCRKECNKGIDIPIILDLMNEATKMTDEGESRMGMAKLYYNSIKQERYAPSACVGCGKCEIRCPQQLNIRKYLRIAVDFLENTDTKNTSKIVRTQLKYLNYSESVKIKFINNRNKNIYAYGAGNAFKKVIKQMWQYGNVVAVIDKDKNKQGKTIEGIKCVDISEVPSNAFIIIAVEDEKSVELIMKDLAENGYCNVDVFWNWICYVKNCY